MSQNCVYIFVLESSSWTQLQSYLLKCLGFLTKPDIHTSLRWVQFCFLKEITDKHLATRDKKELLQSDEEHLLKTKMKKKMKPQLA